MTEAKRTVLAHSLQPNSYWDYDPLESRWKHDHKHYISTEYSPIDPWAPQSSSYPYFLPSVSLRAIPSRSNNKRKLSSREITAIYIYHISREIITISHVNSWMLAQERLCDFHPKNHLIKPTETHVRNQNNMKNWKNNNIKSTISFRALSTINESISAPLNPSLARE